MDTSKKYIKLCEEASKMPSIIIQNEWCVVFCPLCDSSFPRKYILFGKRYCINQECKNHIKGG